MYVLSIITTIKQFFFCVFQLVDDEEILNELGTITNNTNMLGSTELTITAALFQRTQPGASGNETVSF